MYKPSLLFDRTPEEKKDPFLFWQREDQPFFAAGACHILADLFAQMHKDENFKMIYIKPRKGLPGNHVYASDGTWAFDHNGWTKESELLQVTKKAYDDSYPGWEYDRHVIEPTNSSLEEFCKTNAHRLPWQFARLPWERAHSYISKFPGSPPA